jgi:hypothetical protein
MDRSILAQQGEMCSSFVVVRDVSPKDSTEVSLAEHDEVSRPTGLHRRPLAEPSVKLSPHSAPIRQTSAVRIGVILFPVVSTIRPPDPIPSLQPHYEPSSPVRIGPPQCFALVLSPRGFRRLCFSLDIKATGSCSSV